MQKAIFACSLYISLDTGAARAGQGLSAPGVDVIGGVPDSLTINLGAEMDLI